MRYLIFTAKHHDGFCMFDTRLSDYKITRSPLGRDVTAELAAACREAGLLFGLYYSYNDWHHPDYLGPNHDRYLKYLTGQVHELCTLYGPVDLFWFDSVPDSTSGEPLFNPHRLSLQMRRDQPRMVINDRLDEGDFSVCEGGVGRYESFRPWETCIPLGKQWSYKPGDQLKSPGECIRMLVSCAGAGGNLLLGLGPMPSGQIEPRQAAILRQIGQWTSRFGESVFETRKGPIEPADWGTCTRRGSRWYIHVLDWAKGPVTLATTNHVPLRWTVLTGGTAEVKLTSAGIEADVPQPYRKDIDTIVAVDVGKAVATTTSTQP
jgi:alpha-L-fucosidase